MPKTKTIEDYKAENRRLRRKIKEERQSAGRLSAFNDTIFNEIADQRDFWRKRAEMSEKALNAMWINTGRLAHLALQARRVADNKAEFLYRWETLMGQAETALNFFPMADNLVDFLEKEGISLPSEVNDAD